MKYNDYMKVVVKGDFQKPNHYLNMWNFLQKVVV